MKSEQELLQAINGGSKVAMRELYERYSGYAMAVGLRYMADADAVKDVLQDSFVKIFTSIEAFEYRGEGSLKAWVLRIVANEALTQLRKLHRFSVTQEIPDMPDEPLPEVEQVPMSVIMQFIERLPVGYRTVFNLFVFEQRSHKEIAFLLGIKENSSASQYFRAKNMLAKMIDEYKKTAKI